MMTATLRILLIVALSQAIACDEIISDGETTDAFRVNESTSGNSSSSFEAPNGKPSSNVLDLENTPTNQTTANTSGSSSGSQSEQERMLNESMTKLREARSLLIGGAVLATQEEVPRAEALSVPCAEPERELTVLDRMNAIIGYFFSGIWTALQYLASGFLLLLILAVILLCIGVIFEGLRALFGLIYRNMAEPVKNVTSKAHSQEAESTASAENGTQA